MEAVPADTPVTTPDAEPTVATPVLPEVHVPPAVASLSVVVSPAQTTAVPVIADGSGLTVTVTWAELVQLNAPVPVTVYVVVTVGVAMTVVPVLAERLAEGDHE